MKVEKKQHIKPSNSKSTLETLTSSIFREANGYFNLKPKGIKYSGPKDFIVSRLLDILFKLFTKKS